MSPTLLARLRADERETRRLHFQGRRFWLDLGHRDTAIYPRDYYRPADLLTAGWLRR